MSTEMKKSLRSAATFMVVLAMIFAFLISGVRIFGLQVFGVLTGSMEPSYPTGSLVYVKTVDPTTLKISDVITFSVSRNVVATHRIVEKVPDPDNPYSYSFRTKGDANENVDNALVRQSNIIGKVVFNVPMLGYVANYIQHPPGTYVAILIGLILIAFVFLTDSVEEKSGQEAKKPKGTWLEKLPPALQEMLLPLIEKYLPSLLPKDEENAEYLQQGYVPMQQMQYPPQFQQTQPQYVPYPQYPQYPPVQQGMQYQQPQQYPPMQQPQYPQYPPMQQPQYQQMQQGMQYPQMQQYPPMQQPQYPQYPPMQQAPQYQQPQQGYAPYPAPQEYPQQPYTRKPRTQQGPNGER